MRSQLKRFKRFSLGRCFGRVPSGGDPEADTEHTERLPDQAEDSKYACCKLCFKKDSLFILIQQEYDLQ